MKIEYVIVAKKVYDCEYCEDEGRRPLTEDDDGWFFDCTHCAKGRAITKRREELRKELAALDKRP